LAALIGLTLVLAAEVVRAQTRYTIVTNGPAANRINLVLFSEGYTTNQLPSFLSHATNAVNALFSFEPYREYSNYFNAFAIAIASAESGSDHPASAQFRNTYFNSSYGADNFVITIPPSNYPNTFGTGRIGNLLTNLVPEYNTNRDVTILVVNDPIDGGSGGPLTIVSRGVTQPEILAHENAHTIADLGDEYSAGVLDGNAIGEEPNTTTQTNRALIKWNAWIDSTTPVPTPATPAYANAIGLFEGAHYSATGWYRPKQDCMMRTLGAAFCEVCSEALIKSFYERIRPIESHAPAVTNLTVTSGQPLSFNISVLQPRTHNLTIQWRTNGVVVAGTTTSNFSLSPALLGNGSHTIQTEVRDGTAAVRVDPTQLLAQTVNWNVNVSLLELRLDSSQRLATGAFSFRISGVAPQGFVIQGSTNLLDWIPLATNSLAGGEFYFTNGSAFDLSNRFYRAVTPP
jgi:hypothetical protein